MIALDNSSIFCTGVEICDDRCLNQSQDYIFCFPGKPRRSKSAAAHHPSQPQPPLKEKATFVEVDVNVLALQKLDMSGVGQLKVCKYLFSSFWAWIVWICRIQRDVNSVLFFWVGEQIQEMFTISHLHFLERNHDFFSRFTNLAVENLVNYARLLEMKLKRIQFRARHGLMTVTPLPFRRLQLSPGVLVKDLRIQRSFLRPILTMSTASIARFHLSVAIDFIDGLKLESSSCITLLITQLSKGLEAIYEKIATFLEWIFLNYSELLKKSPTKLFEVCLCLSLSLSLSLFNF